MQDLSPYGRQHPLSFVAFVFVFAVFVVGCVGPFIAYPYLQFARSRNTIARSVRVPAVMERISPHPLHIGPDESRFDLSYTYEYAGQIYTSSQVLYDVGFDADLAQLLFDAHPSGSDLEVFVDPESPDHAVIFPTLSTVTLLWPVILTSFVCLVLPPVTWNRWRKWRSFEDEQLTYPVAIRPDCPHVSIPFAGAFAIVLAVMCFSIAKFASDTGNHTAMWATVAIGASAVVLMSAIAIPSVLRNYMARHYRAVVMPALSDSDQIQILLVRNGQDRALQRARLTLELSIIHKTSDGAFADYTNEWKTLARKQADMSDVQWRPWSLSGMSSERHWNQVDGELRFRLPAGLKTSFRTSDTIPNQLTSWKHTVTLERSFFPKTLTLQCLLPSELAMPYARSTDS